MVVADCVMGLRDDGIKREVGCPVVDNDTACGAKSPGPLPLCAVLVPVLLVLWMSWGRVRSESVVCGAEFGSLLFELL